MVKAVNKLVLEINNTENEYFEKAIIILRESCSLSPEQLEAQAAIMLGKTAPECIKRSKKHNTLCMLASAAAGALLSAAVMLIIFVSFV